ncbi:MAG: hypothetical protein LBK60_10855 [Verrucomicrobiales bacterium]|jgi:hypothetical protein|nr:hypothetical protein [Verrucomicrobiales bacterium]
MYPTTSQNGADGVPNHLDAASAHLRTGLRPDGTYPGVSEWETCEHQWRLLETWTANAELILPDDFNHDRIGGREHDVRFDTVSARWFKFTKPASAGYVVDVIDGRLVMTNASPLQYLERWRVHNYLFNDDVRLVGLKKVSPGINRIVISQADVIGEPATWEQLEDTFVRKAGMCRIPYDYPLGGYESCAYFKGRICIFDVRPGNCLVTKKNEVFAIDVIPRFFSRTDANAIERLLNLKR